MKSYYMRKSRLKLLVNKFEVSAEQFFVLSMVISPLFLLTVAGWMTRILVVCTLLAIYVIYKNSLFVNNSGLTTNHKINTDIKILCTTLSLPLLGTFLAQSFSGQYAWAYYDSPAHVLVSALVLIAILRTHGRVIEFMSYTLPIANFLALINIVFHPNLHWSASRLSTQALDPLAFGSLSLTLGLLSLISIKLHSEHSKWLTLYKLLGFAIGIYLSILSGSRTGWIALPVVALFWIYIERKKYKFTTKLISAFVIILLVISGYLLSPTVHQRVSMAADEVMTYKWDAPNADTSIGARISFARMAVFLLEKKPFSGWGDGSFKSVMNDPALDFAVMSTKMTGLTAGFHNEITANMVRSGIWGLISSVAIFLIPALFFMRHLSSYLPQQRNVAFMALAFLTCQFVSSMSMELLNLRYAASFYGLMIAIFCGQILFYSLNDNTHSTSKIR